MSPGYEEETHPRLLDDAQAEALRARIDAALNNARSVMVSSLSMLATAARNLRDIGVNEQTGGYPLQFQSRPPTPELSAATAGYVLGIIRPLRGPN